MNDVLDEACRSLAIPKRLTTLTRDIWQLQLRMSRRQGKRAWKLLEHPKFRAAYDLLALRAEVERNAELQRLVKWWGEFGFPRHQTKKGCSTSWMKNRHRVVVLVVHANAHHVVRVPHDSGVYCHRQQSGLSAGAGQCCPESIRRYP